MAYYVNIESGVGRFRSFGPYANVSEARREAFGIGSQARHARNRMVVSSGRIREDESNVVGEVNCIQATKAPGARILHIVWISDPYGGCILWKMKRDGSLDRRLKDEEWRE